MRRAGFTETRSHPPLQIMLKPTTLDVDSPPAWRMTACYAPLCYSGILLSGLALIIEFLITIKKNKINITMKAII